MATQPRQQQLPRLFIPQSLNGQQPITYADNPQLFSPALPTSISQGMHPPPFLTPSNSLQTPMQPHFFPQPPGAPGRPSMHRSSPSVAQLAAVGIFPPPIPITPLGQTGFPNQMLGLQPFAPPFVPRSKRAPSVGVGGPPKAVLGGPQRRVSPLPPSAPGVSQAAPAIKGKKVVVHFPQETVPGEGDQPPTRLSWARTPLPFSSIPQGSEVLPPETTSTELFPPDSWRYHLPDTVDVFLPGKSAWEDIKRKIIEEKLEKLGVERGTGSSVPHIHAPHARAASISSPADPALLFFKLNKLQQSQNVLSSTSPQPPLSLSTSPAQVPPRFQGRHGHSMSLAQPPSFQSHSPVYNPAAAFNPFGPSATLGSDQVFTRVSPAPAAPIPAVIENIHAPQGRVPANFATLAPPQPTSRPESRPDFLRGFGLDATEEEEEPEEEPPAQTGLRDDAGSEATTEAATEATTLEQVDEVEEDGASTVAQSRIHSRHVSRLSAALSLRSVGGLTEASSSSYPLAMSPQREVVPVRSPLGADTIVVDDADQFDSDAVGEWTGSEDLRTAAEASEDESIGEWSNPSDEERARQDRVQRRILRRAARHDVDSPRRLPNFPRPPDVAPAFAEAEDIVSNPSEEEHGQNAFVYGGHHRGHFPRPSSSGHGRPLPPLPETRPGSAPYSYHDPALAHSREASEQYFNPGGLRPPPPSAPAQSRTESLNPLAKPFVFGAHRQSGSWTSVLSSQPAPITTPFSIGHARAPSFGKPLSAAAPEFKPTGFTFRPPPGVPQLTFSSPQPPRPLPTPPIIAVDSPDKAVLARESQGREKRQRRGSVVSLDGHDEDGVSTMSSFKFPPDNVRAVSAPTSPPTAALGVSKDSSLNVGAKPFTFSGFSQMPSISQQSTTLHNGDEENQPPAEGSAAERTDVESANELPFPPTMKSKRAPIPLDFKHPVSTNTVPAGLFKALVNTDGDDRTRRTVRSRLSSRDIFEHSPRPSLDDLDVPPISHRISRNRLFTDPGFRESSPPRGMYTPDASARRSSRRQDSDTSLSDISIAPVNLSRRIEMQEYERRMEVLLNEKFKDIKRMLSDLRQLHEGQSLSASTEEKISEVVSLFRAQLQASAATSLEDSQMDARGELDFEVIKDIIDQKHMDFRALIQRDLSQLMGSRNQQDAHYVRFAEDLTDRSMNAVVSVTSQLASRIQMMEQPRSSAERDAIIHELLNALLPHLATLRAEPIDYEGLTARLTQAVKPHISQLIDLASDKRETAGLIVDKLVPILPTLHGSVPEFDVEAVVGRLTSEVRKIVAPLDAHEIKEQVSDLVVERLDSRLAVRDRAFNVETLTGSVVQSVRDLLAPIHELQAAVDVLGQKELPAIPEINLDSVRDDVLKLLSDLPQRLGAATEALDSAQVEFKGQIAKFEQDSPLTKNISQLESMLGDMSREQQKLVSQNQEFSDFCQDIVKHIETLPDAMVEATKILHNAHSDFAARDTSTRDSEEIRRLMAANAEFQVQLAKARGAHGQVRVEKDLLADRISAVEAERSRLLSKVESLQDSISARTTEAQTSEARNAELEEALARALDRLKAADVQTQTDSARISQLESSNRELVSEKHQLKSQVDSLNLRATFLTSEKDNVQEELVAQRRINEELMSQQSHWDDLRRASEQIQVLANLVGQVDTEEVKELRRIRDRSKALESDHAVLQRRLKEVESKMASSERIAQTSRQSLAQAQQRAAEWEKRAKEYEGEVEAMQTKLDNAEQAQARLDADYSLVKLQLDERDAEERLDKDRQNKLRDQIASLEAHVARLQAETDQAKKAAATVPVAQPTARYHLNGNGIVRSHQPSRPDSRASTVYAESRANTPTTKYNGVRGPAIRESTPPQPSVWDSIHAPRPEDAINMPITPKTKRAPSYYARQIPSPTPSNVSVAPTLGDDGWWA
ncbi:uncharacterized protein FIBRA_00336 [Fibroporia radiculosa]|uniref:Uncharacterized protein n=1 Tax=Fibroporia radiculosa TaxID=599839 RepID=J7RGX8_9APHY|nr:uncharacterized protein FIBRA_00336 [Fibroporia radiculosa]CCL98342.1 predicted protein [Fibroporia radiculosa]